MLFTILLIMQSLSCIAMIGGTLYAIQRYREQLPIRDKSKNRTNIALIGFFAFVALTLLGSLILSFEL